ncbi:MAG: hypothetical protein AAFQ80_20525 [Cyanobacteria bacterium J06621_8]
MLEVKLRFFRLGLENLGAPTLCYYAKDKLIILRRCYSSYACIFLT